MQWYATAGFRSKNGFLLCAALLGACRIPERYSLVIRSLLTQEGICMTLEPEFHFLEVAYPYVARCVYQACIHADDALACAIPASLGRQQQ